MGKIKLQTGKLFPVCISSKHVGIGTWGHYTRKMEFIVCKFQGTRYIWHCQLVLPSNTRPGLIAHGNSHKTTGYSNGNVKFFVCFHVSCCVHGKLGICIFFPPSFDSILTYLDSPHLSQYFCLFSFCLLNNTQLLGQSSIFSYGMLRALGNFLASHKLGGSLCPCGRRYILHSLMCQSMQYLR
jgi:hypothetical protein